MTRLTDNEIRTMASMEPVHPYPSDRRLLVDECLLLRSELAESHKAHEETLGSFRREYESGLKRCTMLTDQLTRVAAERDRYRDALECIREWMGGREGDQGWEQPEDVWGVANTALDTKP